MSKLGKTEIKIAKYGDDNISLNDIESNQLISYFLRDVRGRKDLAGVLENSDSAKTFSALLERIRSCITTLNLVDAKKLIEQCVPESQHEQIELNLEHARCCFYTENFLTCIDLLQIIIGNRESLPTSRMTAFELLGQTYYKVGKTDEAISFLTRASAQLEFFPYAISGFVAGAHLVKIQSEQGDYSAAFSALDYLNGKLSRIQDDEIWLSRILLILRAKYHIFQNQKNKELALHHLQEAFWVSKWLGDLEMTDKCLCDFESLQTTPSKAKNFMYLPTIDGLLLFLPKRFIRFEKSPVLRKIIQCLLAGPKTHEELFSEVWGLRFNKEQHSNLIRTALTKLRAKLPDNFLKVSDGRIYFNPSQDF